MTTQNLYMIRRTRMEHDIKENFTHYFLKTLNEHLHERAAGRESYLVTWNTITTEKRVKQLSITGTDQQ